MFRKEIFRKVFVCRIFLRRTITAVSYTHLDVYKRQVLYDAIERKYRPL